MSSHQVVEGWRTKGDREKLRMKKMVGKIGKHAEELHHLQSRLATCEFHLWISYSTDNEHCTNALSLSLSHSLSLPFCGCGSTERSHESNRSVDCVQRPLALLFASPAVEVEIMQSFLSFFSSALSLSLWLEQHQCFSAPSF